MSYTPPAGNQAHFTFSGTSFSPPPGAAVAFQWGVPPEPEPPPAPGAARWLSGTITQNAQTVACTVRAYRRDTGALLGETVSAIDSGAFVIDTQGFTGECQVVALPTDPAVNAVIAARVVAVAT